MTVATTPRVGVTFGEVTAGASGWVCSKSGDERPHHRSWYWRCWRSPNPPSSYLKPKLSRSQFLVFSSPKKWQPETRWRLRTRGLTRTGSTHWNYASELKLKQLNQAQPTTDLWQWITAKTTLPTIPTTLRRRNEVEVKNCCTSSKIKKVKSGSCAFVLRYFKLSMVFV